MDKVHPPGTCRATAGSGPFHCQHNDFYLHSKNISFHNLKPDIVGFHSTGMMKLFNFGFSVGLLEKDKDNPAGFFFGR